jgi:hypothetical protein
VKLAKELARRSTGKTLYVLDEPTTGLHFEDVRKLLEVLHRLVDQGNSVVVIEHNLDVIKTADWIIDMGPEGGVRGGQIVAEGTPEQVARNKASLPEPISSRCWGGDRGRSVHSSGHFAGRLGAVGSDRRGDVGCDFPALALAVAAAALGALGRLRGLGRGGCALG